MDNNTICYYNSALDLYLSPQLLDEFNACELTLGKNRYFFQSGNTPFNSTSTTSIAKNKYSTNKILASAGIPVPRGDAMHIDSYKEGKLEEAIGHLAFPLVVKPLDLAKGEGVLCNVTSFEQLRKHIDAHLLSQEFLYFEEFHGRMNSYRVLVFQRQIIGVIQRYPARVLGDGLHSIRDLIELTNQARITTNDALGLIVVDDECQMRLDEQGFDLDSIPGLDQMVPLGYTSNASRGGVFEALNTRICKKNRKLMIRVAATMGLDLVGIDVECPDINVPIESSNGVIIEVNHNPSIKIHEIPLKGKPNRVTKKIVRALIFRHPIAYLCLLCKNKKIMFYARLLFVTAWAGLTYYLLGSLA
ncbi:MAG: UDP-N-acetylmuramyl peptide synthase [Legionellales bacterium]